MQIAQDIAALRSLAGLTQQQIADAIGCSQGHVSHLQNNPAKKPRTSAAVVAGITKLKRKYAKKLAAAPQAS
ncbi:helix-turn-helix transcriptional regulator [Paraburkholderia sp. C35]|uniref:helix-turn-helix domain-containing protein n=1 Tax=Paraburkholderia sp. C35 TaxID=2126993 RepID=UPI000D6915AD|nr:helix-turn-helix transcriptional regulator [Paraburkholderia sp. C35]